MKTALLALLLSPVAAQASDRVVLGYYPSWVVSSFPPSNIDFIPYTHISHAFLLNDPQGNVSSEENQVPSLELTALAHKSGVKVLLALGVEKSGDVMNPMAAKPEALNRYVGNVLSMVEK